MTDVQNYLWIKGTVHTAKACYPTPSLKKSQFEEVI